MTTILDGKKVSEEMKVQLKERVENLKKKGVEPTFAVIRVGDVMASNIYVRNKVNYATDIGVKCKDLIFTEDEMYEIELIKLILELNRDNNIHGIIVQLPLPKGYDVSKIISFIRPDKDIDGFTITNLGKLMNNEDDAIVAATPRGIMNLLKAYDIDVSGKRCLVIGRGKTVGKPLAQLLINNDAIVTVAHSKVSQDELEHLIFSSNIVFTCVGKYSLFDTQDVVDGTVIIDAGITRTPEGKLCGDFNSKEFYNTYNLTYSPVPGGVGPMTIQALMENLIDACERQIRIV